MEISQWIGAYEECSNLPDAKYCSSPIRSVGHALVYGSCFPKECKADDVAEVMRVVTNYTKGLIEITEEVTFCDKPTAYSTGAVITIVILAAVLLLCIIGTLVEFVQGISKTEENLCSKGDEPTRAHKYRSYKQRFRM